MPTTGAAACKICQTRRPKRYCPGVVGDICTICCGTEREVSVNCPLDCVYLRQAREHERLPEIDPRQLPNSDIRVNEDFLRRNEPVLILCASALAKSALKNEGTLDRDVHEALDSLIRTYKVLENSGLIYESRPENPVASRVFADVQETISDIRKRLEQHSATLRDADVLGVLAFLQRLGIQHDNRRPKSRAFIDFLRSFFPVSDSHLDAEPPSGLITTS